MKFRHKLILAFSALIVTTIVPVVLILNSKISEIGINRILTNLISAENTFSSVYQNRKDFFIKTVDSLVKTDPQLRAVLGSLNNDSTEEDLFGDTEGSENDEQIKKANERLRSSLSFLPIYKESDKFCVLDTEGRVLLEKSEPDKINKKALSEEIIEYLQEGRTYLGWKQQGEKFYEIFIQPLVLKNVYVKGYIYVGREIKKSDLLDLKEMANVDVVLMSKGELVSSSINNFKAKDLTQNEDYISREIALLNSFGNRDGTIYILRSLSSEIRHFENIKKILFIITAVVAFVGLFFAIFMSGAVTKSLFILKEVLQNVKQGNLDKKAEVKTKDEFKQLADSVNEMIDGLKDGDTVKKIFGKYVDSSVAEQLLQNKDDIKLGGERKQVAVFFSDLADFTSISEKLTPEETIEFLNKYLTVMSNIIKEQGGIIDSFIGDAILAYWPESDEAGACSKAVAAALEQKLEMDKLRKEYESHTVLKNIGLRIGIHFGPVIVGNVGSLERMSHTVIGDSVNLASRLEALNKSYNTTILISEDVISRLAEKPLNREVDKVQVKGKNIPVTLFEVVVDKLHQDQEVLAAFSKALNLYREAKFELAADLFKSRPEDGVARIFHQRCLYFINNPNQIVGDKWDGVFRFNIK